MVRSMKWSFSRGKNGRSRKQNDTSAAITPRKIIPKRELLRTLAIHVGMDLPRALLHSNISLCRLECCTLQERKFPADNKVPKPLPRMLSYK